MQDIAAYSGRKFDLLALRGAVPVGAVELQQSLFDGNIAGEVCTGVQKLAQRWVMEFLTERGSMKFLPDRGTDFWGLAMRSAFQTEFDVIAAFNTASVYVYENLTNEEDDTWHPEDRLVSAELLQLIIETAGLAMRIQITSRAGDARAIILPVPITPTTIR